jgi:hypothetical protein
MQPGMLSYPLPAEQLASTCLLRGVRVVSLARSLVCSRTLCLLSSLLAHAHRVEFVTVILSPSSYPGATKRVASSCPLRGVLDLSLAHSLVCSRTLCLLSSSLAHVHRVEFVTGGFSPSSYPGATKRAASCCPLRGVRAGRLACSLACSRTLCLLSSSLAYAR